MDHVEIIDLETNTAKRCPKYPLKVAGATGGLIGSSPLICGGSSPRTAACYIIGQQETVAVTMTTPRSDAASIVFNGRLFIAGDGSSTEWISLEEGATPAGALPISLYGHSMELIQSTTSKLILIIGGWSSSGGQSAKTFYGNPLDSPINWTDGPDLMEARRYHASAIMNEGTSTSVIVSGGWPLTDTVEILSITGSPQDWSWKQGKFLFCFSFSHPFVDFAA